MERGSGSGMFPPIPKDHPLAEAARAVNAYAEEHGIEATLEWLAVDVTQAELNYLCEQRALMGVAGSMLGYAVTATPAVNVGMAAVMATPLWKDLAPLLLSLILDGISIGWKGHEINGKDESVEKHVIPALRRVLESKTSPGLVEAIVEDLLTELGRSAPR